MKQKDIVTIVFIIGISVIISIAVSKLLISTPKNRLQKVEVVDKVSAEFSRPDNRIFNSSAINPTRNIQIGIDSNTKPFNGKQ